MLRTLLTCALLTQAAPARAQNYLFAVPNCQFEVFVQKDASVRLKYAIQFRNGAGAHAIDIVDVGLPHKGYDFANMRASIGGTSLTDIRKSEYVNPGVEVHLGSGQIPAGGTGTFTFECTMPDLVYQDTTKKEHASLRITPTWFGSQYVSGNTRLQIAVHLPEGVQPGEVLYQLNKQFTQKAVYEGHAVAYWEFANTRFDKEHMVGLSFPKDVMDRVVTMTVWQLLAKWFGERVVGPFARNEPLRLASALLLMGAVAFGWLRLTGGTGGCLLVVLLIGAIIVAGVSPGAHLATWPLALAFVCLTERARGRRKRRYLPPIISVEGGGIKRGLTAPEAAVVLELPLNKVLTLVITGLLKKGLVEQEGDQPLKVSVKPRYQGAKKHRLNNAQKDGIVVHNYEHSFIAVLTDHAKKPVAEIEFAGPMRDLIRATARKMKGFNLDQTRDYYRSIIAKAWEDAEAIGEIPEREKKIDKHLEWLILEDDFDGRFGRWRRRGYTYYPPWSRPVVVPHHGPVEAPSAGAGGPAPAPDVGGRTSFGDVANSFVGSAENLMGQTAVKLDPVSLGTGPAETGVVDLSGFDKVAGDFFQALSESSGSGGGGGGGGGCACACAGCACACACAGGGR